MRTFKTYLRSADENSNKQKSLRRLGIQIEKILTRHRLSALRDSMLGKFTRKDETNWSLDFTGWDSRLLGVRGKLCNSCEPQWAIKIKTSSLDASVAIRSKISLTKLLRMAMALLEIPVSGWTCLRTRLHMSHYPRDTCMKSLTFVDIWRIGLLSDLLTFLLVITVSSSRNLWSLLRSLRGLCRLRRGLGSSRGGSLSSGRCGFRCHKLTIYGSESTIRWW